MRARAAVTVTSHFGRYNDRLERAALRAFADAGAHGARVAREKAPVDTGELRDSIRYSHPRRTRKGVEVSIESGVPHALWQELGTLRRRRTRLRASTIERRSTPSGTLRFFGARGGGVRPKRFLNKGKLAARDKAEGLLAREIGRIR